jgi:hypothetical protein
MKVVEADEKPAVTRRAVVINSTDNGKNRPLPGPMKS